MNPPSLRSLPCLLLVLLAFGCSETSGGTTMTGGPPRDGGAPTDAPVAAADSPPDLTATSIETVAPTRVRAGEAIAVRCEYRNRAGERVEIMGAVPTVAFEPEMSVRRDGDRVIAVRVGQVSARCSLASPALRDETPSVITIDPGAPARVTTRLDRATVTAGEDARATCEVTDSEGNVLRDATTTVTTSPMGEGIRVMGNTVSATRSGMYTVSCQATGAMGDWAPLTVNPALPRRFASPATPTDPCTRSAKSST